MAETIVLIEHDRGRVAPSSLCAISLARHLGDGFALLLLGHELKEASESLVNYGAQRVLVVDNAAIARPLADKYADAIASVVRTQGARTLVASSSTFSKDILPRTAALLDAGMLTDVVGVAERDGARVFRRPMYAGNALATVRLDGDVRVLTARAAAFDSPEKCASASPIEHVTIDASSLPVGMRFVSREERNSDRPDLTEARVVVSGGRPLKDRATFEKLVGGLADILGGAVGTTRAAVDAGIAPNDWQIGQTGKVIAPDLYIAAGVSGAIQHLAGIKDSRVIVAINKDAEAPIFQVATYGLVADLHEAVPELIEALEHL